jgi:hypothetical protein
VNHYDSRRPPHKRARVSRGADGGENAEIFPFGVAPPPNHVHHPEENDDEEGNDWDDDEGGEDDDEHDEDDEDLLVGGRLVFPCPACRPGHPSGYICPIPIPEPTEEMQQAEAQDYLNGQRAIVEPERGQRRIPLEHGLHNVHGIGNLL